MFVIPVLRNLSEKMLILYNIQTQIRIFMHSLQILCFLMLDLLTSMNQLKRISEPIETLNVADGMLSAG